MVLKNGNDGLCITCNNKDDCSHFVVINGPIVCCEEFDNYTPDTDILVAASKQDFIEKQISKKKCGGDVYGLCIDCDNVNSCNTAKNFGGVWHCEEYK
jgi:hypothetical protein